jgi:hypothetical protein
MSALGHKRTFRNAFGMSALPPKAAKSSIEKLPLFYRTFMDNHV